MKMTEIGVEKIKILFLSYLYFPKEQNNNKEKNEKYNIPLYDYDNLMINKEIEKLELIEQSSDFNRKAKFIYDNNLFTIKMQISNKKLNDFQRKFTHEISELGEEKKNLTIVSQPEMNIYFYFSDIEFMFYKANFASIINNNQNAELFIYLKKFKFKIEIKIIFH